MFTIKDEKKTDYTYLGLFAGAGGLDLGFELAGFTHTISHEILDCAIKTLRSNRPNWEVIQGDVREYTPDFREGLDVLLAGFPCQGFSLGGKREANDPRNTLYKEVIRIAKHLRPRVVVMENVLNLRTMIHPVSNKPFCEQIAEEMATIGYKTVYKFFRVSEHGVPQTRRRFIFVAYRDDLSFKYHFPEPCPETSIRSFIYDLAQDSTIELPNHNPTWGLRSKVHFETHEPFPESEEVLPIRISRTASDGFPIRSFDSPFPAIDTATVWGWAQGNINAKRVEKDRLSSSSQYVRNTDSEVTLWRITASRMRAFTDREYARLQTFPDDWVFYGDNKRDIHLQIGNAVPVIFAKKIALSIRTSLESLDGRKGYSSLDHKQLVFDF